MVRKTLTPLEKGQIGKIEEKLNAEFPYEIIPVQILESVSKEQQCYANVVEKIKLDNGSIHYGWSVHFNQGLIIEAERHAVWEDENGDLVCVTPHPAGYDTVIFISDNTPVDKQWDTDNVRLNITANPLVNDWITALNAIGEFNRRFSTRVDDDMLAVAAGTEQAENALHQEAALIYGLILGKRAERTDCFCGSRRKYMQCHHKNLGKRIDEIMEPIGHLALR
ncbi:hypothetical protein [Flavobacterium undicola]|uniref:hypothetical protein n=1 Tax=Flavobacterium undicola TaxID=1932779 RepID=UPI001378C4D2|nr:hypothetical protein [Flavobacterium undicola]MBA0882461.1 hypothetical protein [Flavobacterium undicola]